MHRWYVQSVRKCSVFLSDCRYQQNHLILIYQLKSGLIQDADKHKTELMTVVYPYLTLLGGYLAFELIRAPLVLHRQQENRIRDLENELEKARPNEEEGFRTLLGGYLKNEPQRQHTDAMDRLSRALAGDSASRIRAAQNSPIGTVRFLYENGTAYVQVTNSGRIAEFHGSFDVLGPVTARRQRGLPCRWENSVSAKLRIARDETCRIVLAELISTGSGQFLTTQWKLYSSPEHEESEFSTLQSSAVNLRPPQLANPLLIDLSVMADPDLANGIQKLWIVLASFGARLAQREEIPNV